MLLAVVNYPLLPEEQVNAESRLRRALTEFTGLDAKSQTQDNSKQPPRPHRAFSC